MAQGLRRAVNAATAAQGKPPPCDWDAGTASSGPRKCGRPAKFTWADETARRDRPVCGIHARSAKAKFHGDVTPISAENPEDLAMGYPTRRQRATALVKAGFFAVLDPDARPLPGARDPRSYAAAKAWRDEDPKPSPLGRQHGRPLMTMLGEALGLGDENPEG